MFFLTHQDSAVADTLAHLDYVLTTSNGSLALCWLQRTTDSQKK